MTWLRVLLALGLAATVSTARAASVAPRAMFPGPDVRMEVINLPSAPPGKMAEAPGGGVVTTPAVLFNPASGENAYGPAIVMIDEGPGSNPLRLGEPARVAAARLAARGYTVVSLYTHLERGYSLFSFASTGPEIDAALYFLEQRGHEDFALVGKGYGAIVAADYLRKFKDEGMDSPGVRRVKALALMSPLTELRAYPGAGLLGPGYEAEARAAAASVASGAGRYPAGNTLEVGGGAAAKADPWIAAGPYNGPPEFFTEWFGPEAAARNAAALSAVKLPTLLLGAGRDPGYVEAHARALLHPAKLEVKSYLGVDSHFTGAEAQAASDLGDWLGRQGLAPRPKVVETAMDIVAADGTSLPAVIYAPEGGADSAKPTLLFIHGRTGDTVQSSGHWVGWRLAQRGYTVVTPRLRVSGAAGFNSATLADTADDIGRWVDALDRAGLRRLVAVGHSNGGIYISVYMAKAQDPRVAGVVFMAPTVNEREHTIARDGQAKVDADLAEAKAAIDRGEGLTHVVGLISARIYYDVNKPSALSEHTAQIKLYSRPTLSIIGSTDALFQNSDFTKRFLAGQKPGLAKLIIVPGGTHGFRESKDLITADIDGWIKETFPSHP